MATIHDGLRNAKHNLCDARPNAVNQLIGFEQLKNAVTLLDLGYTLDDDVEELLLKHGDLASVPECS